MKLKRYLFYSCFFILILGISFSKVYLIGDKYHSKTVFVFEGKNVTEVKLPVDVDYFKNLSIIGAKNWKIYNTTIYFDRPSNVKIVGFLPIYICDYSPMPNMSGKDVYIVDICSAAPKIIINKFIFYNLTALKNRSIDYIIYYPYTKENQNGLWKDYFRLDDFKYIKKNHTLVINDPLIVYRSEHSNVFALVLKNVSDKVSTEKEEKNNSFLQLIVLFVLLMVIYFLIKKR